jgi:protocatechuate 3,4-dioxygenase beta subunit
MKQLSGFTVLLLLALAAPLARAEPAPGSIPIRGRISPPVAPDTRVELLPVSIGAAEAVRLLSGEPEPPLATVRPAADGTFVLMAPEPGFYRVAVRAEGFLSLETSLHPLLAETDLPPVRLRQAQEMEVVVIGANGRPAAGIAVLGLPSSGGNDPWLAASRRAISDEDGLLRLPRREGETLTLAVVDPGFFGQIANSGDGRTTLRLKQRPLVEIRVRDANGRPLPGAVLWGGPFPLAASGTDGRFRVASDLPPGLVETLDGREAPLSLAPGESSRTVTPVPREIRTGRVLEAVTRAPLPGALVWQQKPGQDRIVWTRAEADGSFRLAADPHTPLLALAPGFLTASTPESLPEGSLSLILEPAVSLAGRVVDGAGRPVAGAVVEALPATFSRTMDWERGRTTADGTFLLSRLGVGQEYRLTVKAEGFLPARLDATPGPRGEKQPPLRIVLNRGAAVAGRLVDPQGRPVAGAALSLIALQEGAEGFQTADETLRAASDPAGRFRFEPAAPGRFLLELIHPELALASRPTVEVAGPRQVDLGDVRLGPAAAIEGLVTDGRGAPLPGAQISLGFTAPGAPREPTLSGPDGRFRLGGLAPGGRFDLFVYLPGHLPHQAPGVEAPSPEPLRISLRPARSLTGRVVDSGGRPIPGVTLSVVETQELRMAGGSHGGSSSRGVGQTDSEGRFVTRDLEPGTFHLTFQAAGFRPEVVRGLAIREEEDPAPLEVVLERGAVLSGRVADSRGRPAAGLRIFVLSLERADPLLPSDSWEETDAEGRYRIAGLTAGRNRIEVQDWSHMRRLLERTVTLGSGDQRLDLELPTGHRISGRVVDEQGEPVPGTRLMLVLVGQPPLRADSGPEGGFRFTDVPEGTWRLTGSARGQAPLSEEVRVAGGDLDDLVLRLSPAATITGRLLGLTELERNQVEIMAWPEPGRGGVVTSQMKGSVDGGGGYKIPDVGPGTWNVQAFLPSGRNARGVVQVSAAGEEATLDLEIPRGLTLSGRILLDGRPFTNAGITLATIENGWPTNSLVGVTRHDGTFELQGVKPGRVTLAVMAQGIGHARALDVASDQEVTIEILTGLVNGHVLSADGQPAEGALVTLHGEDASLTFSFQSFQTRSDERGAFELPRVAAGSYRVTVSHPGSAPMEQRIVVTPGGTTRVEAVLK